MRCSGCILCPDRVALSLASTRSPDLLHWAVEPDDNAKPEPVKFRVEVTVNGTSSLRDRRGERYQLIGRLDTLDKGFWPSDRIYTVSNRVDHVLDAAKTQDHLIG